MLTLQDEPSDYHSNIYFMRSKNTLHFSPELFQNQLISSSWKRAHCSFDTKDRALLFSFKSAFGGWTAERELSFIMLPCQKDTTLCKRNEVEQKKNLLSFPHGLSHWHTIFKLYYSFALSGRFQMTVSIKWQKHLAASGNSFLLPTKYLN